MYSWLRLHRIRVFRRQVRRRRTRRRSTGAVFCTSALLHNTLGNSFRWKLHLCVCGLERKVVSLCFSPKVLVTLIIQCQMGFWEDETADMLDRGCFPPSKHCEGEQDKNRSLLPRCPHPLEVSLHEHKTLSFSSANTQNSPFKSCLMITHDFIREFFYVPFHPRTLLLFLY